MSLIVEPRNLPPEGMHITGNLQVGCLDLDYHWGVLAGALKYDLWVEVVGHEFLARGRLSVPFKFICSRCLKPITREIQIENYNLNVKVTDVEIIDLTESVREDIIIALPLRPLCDGECKGICPKCGKDLNLGPCGCKHLRGDSRWRALEGIKLPPED